jgi:hypothetical protein
MSDDDMIRRRDARDVCADYGAAGEMVAEAIRALPAAQTFTAADLASAFRMALAMAEARAVFCGLSPDTGKSSDVARAIRALSVPPDLAARVEEARK